MKRIDIITRPEKLEGLKELLTIHNAHGMTVSSVMGCGKQNGYIPELGIVGGDINLLPKVLVFSVIDDEDLDDLLVDISNAISTGKSGDGKVFVYEVYDAMRIRTNERGSTALK